jgi:hypothetical protein
MKTLKLLVFTKFFKCYIFQYSDAYELNFYNILIVNILYFLFKVKLEVRQLLEVFQNFTLINKLQL